MKIVFRTAALMLIFLLCFSSCLGLAEKSDIWDSLSVGDTVSFGSYECDGKTSNGSEKIEWIVLAVEKGKTLLLTKKGIDVLPFEKDDDASSIAGLCWEKSSLRDWLNTDFYSSAFGDDEKQRILATSVQTSDAYGTTKTTDSVFLLSKDEVKKYLPNEGDRVCYPTAYAKKKVTMKGALGSNSQVAWWLRDMSSAYKSGGYSFMSTTYNEILVIGHNGAFVTENIANIPWVDTAFAVRPEIWVSNGNGGTEEAEVEAAEEKVAPVNTVSADSIDFSSMSFAELVELQNNVNLALWNSDEWQEVTVPEGVWTVGQDIPAGKWTIKVPAKGYIHIYWCDKLDEFGAVSYKGKLYEIYTLKGKQRSSYTEGDTTEITLNLQEGQYVGVDNGDAIFTPYAGNSFSFK